MKCTDQNLHEMIEKIIFNGQQLTELRLAINKLNSGDMTSKELRKKIVKFRVELIERLVEFFPFYWKQINTEDSLKSFITPQVCLTDEIQEKDKFLEEVGIRVNNIYEKLKESPDI